MANKWRRITQATFLVLFVVVVVAGRSQVWMALFLGSVLLALFFGRLYCGWVCPINTVTELITRMTRKLGVKRLAVPEFIKKPVFRYGMLAAFIATMAFVLIGGKKLPVLAVLLVLGAVVSLIFQESIWHRYLCPYGTILNAASTLSRYYLKIDGVKCGECGLCGKVCPGEAVTRREKYSIDKGLCLQCLECITNCPRQAIHY